MNCAGSGFVTIIIYGDVTKGSVAPPDANSFLLMDGEEFLLMDGEQLLTFTP